MGASVPGRWVVLLFILQLQCGAAQLPTLNSLDGPSEITMSEYLLSDALQDIQWLNVDKRTVILQTEDGRVYLSLDEGKVWSDVSTRLQQLSNTATPIEVADIKVSLKDPRYVFLLCSGPVSFFSKDAGTTWIASQVADGSSSLDDVVLHPTDESRLLGSTLSKKCDRKEEEGQCFKTLYTSADFGATWTFANNYVVQFDWVRPAPGRTSFADPASAGHVLATVFNRKGGNQKFGFWDADVDLVISKDLFKTTETLVKGGNRFLFTDKFIFVAQVLRDRGGEVLLQMSKRGETTFYPGNLPFQIKQHSYTVLDTSEDSVFLHVNHKGDGSTFGHVYISDALGMNYSLSLPHNSRDQNGKCDFEKMEGLEGIYIANFVENAEQIEKWNARQAEEGGAMGRSGAGRAGKKQPRPQVRTVITFDKGGKWGYITPPTKDATGQPIQCGEGKHCSLHLHGVTDEWGPFYSAASATGLILATGNVGPALATAASSINTYFSRDAGVSWAEVRKGSRIYELGDHGGLIVMADDVNPTTSIEFSVDEGASWRIFEFSPGRPMLVDNIIIEPSARSRKFIVYGTRPRVGGEGEDVGVLFLIDFTGFHERNCVGVESAGSESSDFELWAPSGLPQTHCLMGRTVTYTRRKPLAACYHADDHERISTAVSCSCAESDYECDFGYMRREFGTPCVRDPNVDLNTTTATAAAGCTPGGTYTLSNGYRKVAGDTCTVSGGLDFMPTVYPCKGGIFGVSHSGWLVLLIVLGLAGGLTAVTYKSKLKGGAAAVFGPLGGIGGGLGTRHFGDGGGSGPISVVSSIFAAAKGAVLGGGAGRFKYTMVGQQNGPPDSAMDFGQNDYEDYDDSFGLEDEDEEDEAELMPATTTACPLAPAGVRSTGPVPRLNSPPGGGTVSAANPFSDPFGDAV